MSSAVRIVGLFCSMVGFSNKISLPLTCYSIPMVADEHCYLSGHHETFFSRLLLIDIIVYISEKPSKFLAETASAFLFPKTAIVPQPRERICISMPKTNSRTRQSLCLSYPAAVLAPHDSMATESCCISYVFTITHNCEYEGGCHLPGFNHPRSTLHGTQRWSLLWVIYLVLAWYQRCGLY